MKKRFRIGSRGSRLALIQAEMVEGALRAALPECETEIKVFKTKGDKILDSPLSAIGDKGLFIRELEEGLLSGGIDLAVHSLKDMPTELPDGLCIGAVLERGEYRDAFISPGGRRLESFKSGGTVATSSLRRRAQLLSEYPDLEIVDIRGNVDTRLRKMESGYCDGLVLAGAGLIRSGFEERITEYLDADVFLPAVCQGIVCMEVRRDDEAVLEAIAGINHEPTFRVSHAERAFLRALEGGCQIPIGCRSHVEGEGSSGETYTIEGFLSDISGTRVIRKKAAGKIEDAVSVAGGLAEDMLNDGGREILEEIRGGLNE